MGACVVTLAAVLATSALARAQEEPPDLDRDGVPDVLESEDAEDREAPVTISDDPVSGPIRRGIRRREGRHEALPTAEDREEQHVRIEDDLERSSRDREPPQGIRSDRPMLRAPFLPRIVHADDLGTELTLAVGVGAFDIDPETLLAVPVSAAVEVAASRGRVYFGFAYAGGAGESVPGEFAYAPGGLQAWGRFVTRIGRNVALGAGGGIAAPVYDSDDISDRLAADRVMFTHLPDRLMLEFDLIAPRAFVDAAFRSGMLFLQARAGLDLWIPIGNRDDIELGLRAIAALGLLPSDAVQAGVELALVSVPTATRDDSVGNTDFRLALFGEAGSKRARVGIDAWIGLDRWGPSTLSLGATGRVSMLF